MILPFVSTIKMMTVLQVESQRPIMTVTEEVVFKMHVMVPMATLMRRMVCVMYMGSVHVRCDFVWVGEACNGEQC